MKPSAPPLGLDSIRDQAVVSAITALNTRDRKRWFELFSENAKFSDDGILRDLRGWCEEELFGSVEARIISIDKVEGGGLTFYARYHSDRWGDFKTYWRFKVEDGKISRLDVGATDY